MKQIRPCHDNKKKHRNLCCCAPCQEWRTEQSRKHKVARVNHKARVKARRAEREKE